MSAAALTTAALLLAQHAVRIATQADPWQWWVPVALLAGIAAADLGSGLVHWAADTWGRDDCPVIGPRLLVPFRVHHVNPDDFLRRRFLDTNGDVAVAAIPVLLALHSVPLERTWGPPAVLVGLGFCGFGALTNQIHQWAHMPAPPPPIRLLQSAGLFLGRVEHAQHHSRPYDSRYCITTGWCNRPLEALGFFRRAERLVTFLTGMLPRHDDRRYETRQGLALAGPQTTRG